jgi:hypothetical protein
MEDGCRQSNDLCVLGNGDGYTTRQTSWSVERSEYLTTHIVYKTVTVTPPSDACTTLAVKE